MAETILSEPPTLSMDADDDDDLPRTIRREREARARDARERLSMDAAPMHAFEHRVPYGFAAAPMPAGPAAAFDVPFSKLMTFFVKAVLAAIPALIVLITLFWLVGHGLQAFFPDLVKLKVLIYMPK